MSPWSPWTDSLPHPLLLADGEMLRRARLTLRFGLVLAGVSLGYAAFSGLVGG
jgi:hypothetical protein